MPVPDYQTLMLPVLQIMLAGKTSVADCLPELQKRFDISDAEAQELIPSGYETILSNRAHWARSYLSKAGLTESPRRNYHVVTELGRRLLATNPDKIDVKTLSAIPEFDEWRRAGSSRKQKEQIDDDSTVDDVAPNVETPDETLDRLTRQIDKTLADDLLETLLTVTPARFERIVIDLLTAMGFGGGVAEMARVVGRSGDGGIDGVVNEDALGLDAVYVQAKRYTDTTVGRPAVQAFVGSMTGENATKGVFVTTSKFSSEAREYVRRVQQRIVLIDGDRLAKLMIGHDVGVRTERTYRRKALDGDYFDDK